MKTIAFLISSRADYGLIYERFFYDNLFALENNGIAYPWLGPCQDIKIQKGFQKNTASFASGNEAAISKFHEYLSDKNHLLFVNAQSHLHWRRLLDFFRSDQRFSGWANAEIRVVWIPTAWENAAEAAALRKLPSDKTEEIVQVIVKYKDQWLADMRPIFCNADHVKIITAKSDGINEGELLTGLGISLPEVGRVPLRKPYTPSREQIYMSGNLRQILPPSAAAPEIKASGFTLVPPDRLAEIHNLYTPLIETLAAEYGCDLKLEKPRPQPDWSALSDALPDEKAIRGIIEAHLEQSDSSEKDLVCRLLENAYRPVCQKRNNLAYAGELRNRYDLPKPETPLLTVLTLAKNHEKYIGECIESIQAQRTSFPIRHLILDDGSNDSTPHIIRQYGLKYPNIYPIFLDSSRATGANVKTLFSACRSQYAALCDGDDYFTDPYKLQKQVDFLEARPHCAMAFHPVQVCYENNPEKNFVFPPADKLPRGLREEYYLADLIKGNFLQTNSVVYRWRFTSGLPAWFRGDLCPGDWYWHLLHAETGKIGYLPEIMSVYRRHDKALYEHGFQDAKAHRRANGMMELETFTAIDEHFKGRYFRDLASLANGVFVNFLELFIDGDSTLLDRACQKYPGFGNNFLKNLKICKK